MVKIPGAFKPLVMSVSVLQAVDNSQTKRFWSISRDLRCLGFSCIVRSMRCTELIVCLTVPGCWDPPDSVGLFGCPDIFVCPPFLALEGESLHFKQVRRLQVQAVGGRLSSTDFNKGAVEEQLEELESPVRREHRHGGHTELRGGRGLLVSSASRLWRMFCLLVMKYSSAEETSEASPPLLLRLLSFFCLLDLRQDCGSKLTFDLRLEYIECIEYIEYWIYWKYSIYCIGT